MITERFTARVVARGFIEMTELLHPRRKRFSKSLPCAMQGGEEVTVKRLYRNGEMVRLIPENGDYEEIVVRVEEVRIQEEVVFVIHPPRR